MRRRGRWLGVSALPAEFLLAPALLAACGDDDDVRADGMVADAAVDVALADAGVQDVDTIADAATDAGLPLLSDVCRADDGDQPAILPTVAEAPQCVAGILVDSTGSMFTTDLGTLPDDYTALHALCARMDPTANTRDDLDDASLAADIRGYFTSLLARPALARVLSHLPDDAARITALELAWLKSNGFEHVLCGDLNPNGNVGGLHLWSEAYLAEREGRLDFACRIAPVDPHVATTTFFWDPPGPTGSTLKPIGGFHIGMSPACLLAIGYQAVRTGVVPVPGNQPALRAELYGVTRGFALGLHNGGIVTLFPIAE